MYFFLVIPRTSQGMYPALPPTPPGAQPSAPPADEGYDSGGNSRCIIRPHSISPFTRNVKPKGEEEDEQMDFDAITCLLNFSTRREVTTVNSFGEENVTVRTFSTPTTPAAAPRPEHPPQDCVAEDFAGGHPAP